MNDEVISKIQKRLDRDDDALKRVLQSLRITKKQSYSDNIRNVSDIKWFFPNTPVTMLKDVFEALQLYDLLELLEMKSAIKPHGSLQLAYTLDEIKKLNGVTDLPTTYHSCGAVLIITNDENVSITSAIKTFFTKLDNNSDVTKILARPRIPTMRHVSDEINAMILEISARFGNSSERETQRQTVVPHSLFLSPLNDVFDELKQSIRQITSGHETVIFTLTQLTRGIRMVKLELKHFITELRQNDELTRFLQSMMVTAERIQENLTQLMKRRPAWFFIEEEKEKKEEENFQENVSAVINRWIHRQG